MVLQEWIQINSRLKIDIWNLIQIYSQLRKLQVFLIQINSRLKQLFRILIRINSWLNAIHSQFRMTCFGHSTQLLTWLTFFRLSTRVLDSHDFYRAFDSSVYFQQIDSNQLMTQLVSQWLESIQLMAQAAFQELTQNQLITQVHSQVLIQIDSWLKMHFNYVIQINSWLKRKHLILRRLMIRLLVRAMSAWGPAAPFRQGALNPRPGRGGGADFALPSCFS